MHSLKLVITATLLFTSTVSFAQDNNAKIGEKQKAWLPPNFRSFNCAVAPGPSSALIGAGTVSFEASEGSGVDVAVTSGDSGVPTITAHAINSKGTGATNGRMVTQSCLTANSSSDSSAAACSVSGDVESPAVRFTLPLEALGGLAAAKSYVGTVTIVKRTSTNSMIGMYLSKKGYDHYQAQSDKAAAKGDPNPALMVIASCDSSKLTAKGGKPMAASYDLAVAKK